MNQTVKTPQSSAPATGYYDQHTDHLIKAVMCLSKRIKEMKQAATDDPQNHRIAPTGLTLGRNITPDGKRFWRLLSKTKRFPGKTPGRKVKFKRLTDAEYEYWKAAFKRRDEVEALRSRGKALRAMIDNAPAILSKP